MTHFDIKVVSDIVCPFCYLGKKRVEKAIDLYKKRVPGGDQDTFNLTWYPFYLDPTLPKKGVPIHEHMAAKFGADRIEMLDRRLRMMGQADGINFTQQGKVGNTRDAHRLAQLAKTKGLETQNSVMAELFRSYFEEGGDVTSREMLITAGKKGGLEETEVKGWLESDEGGKEVDQEVDQACRAGVHSVPNFTINGRFTVYGAQGVEDFLGEFIAAKEEATKSSGFQKPSMGC